MTDLVNNSSYTIAKGTNSLVMSELAPNGCWFIMCSHEQAPLGLVTPVFSIVGLLILYSKNVLNP